MKNLIVCPNCNHNNPLYALNCQKCNAFLRSKIANLDFWDISWNIFTSPIETSKIIIQSEKKNYLFFILSLIIVKMTINHFIIKNYFSLDTETEANMVNSFIYGGLISVLILTASAFLFTYVLNILKIETRFRDNITLLAYSFIPMLFAFLFLTPFHLALFGLYWYTVNPLPFIIKPTVSYVLYGIEALFIGWLLFLFIKVLFVQSRRVVLSTIFGIIIFILLAFSLVFFP